MAKSAYNRNQHVTPPRKRQWYIYVLVFVTAFFFLATCGFVYVMKVNPGAVTLTGGRHGRVGSIFGGPQEFNLLVAGLDIAGSVNRTDSIIVAHINLRDKYANLVSVPRDFRVEIPGHGKHKINEAYGNGGPELLMQTLENLLGAKIDYYVILRTSGVEKIIDAMGGVDIEVEKRLKYTDRSQNLYIDLQPGQQHLDGKKALGYARFRHDARGDFARIERQQKLIDALARQALSVAIIKHLPKLMGELSKNNLIETNIKLSAASAMARKYDDQLRTNTKYIMAPGVPKTIRGVSYVIPDYDEIPYISGAMLNGGYHPRNKAVLISLQNGCGSPRLATIYKTRLEYFGFQIVETDNASDFDHDRTTVVVKHPSPFAGAIARLLDADTTEEIDTTSKVDLEVILGRDKISTGE